MTERNPEWGTEATKPAINLDYVDDPHLRWVFDLEDPYAKRKPRIICQSFKATRS